MIQDSWFRKDFWIIAFNFDDSWKNSCWLYFYLGVVWSCILVDCYHNVLLDSILQVCRIKFNSFPMIWPWEASTGNWCEYRRRHCCCSWSSSLLCAEFLLNQFSCMLCFCCLFMCWTSQFGVKLSAALQINLSLVLQVFD